MHPTVTIIVCAYNSEHTMSESLESATAQDYAGAIELIIVDDGSTDSTGDLADQFAESHPGVRVVHQSNAGLGAARNAALRVARGQYVAFLDADDLLPPDAIRLRVEAMTSTGAALAVCRMELFPGDQKWQAAKDFEEDAVIAGVAERPGLLASTSSLNKLFYRSFFDDPRNRFVEGVHFEDLPPMTAALVTARRIAILARPGYRYRKIQGSGSIMDRRFTGVSNYLDHLTVNEMVFNRFTCPADRTLLEPFLIRKIAPYLERAAGALAPDDFGLVFHRARQVYGNVPAARIAAAVTSRTQRLAFLGILADDPDLLYQLEGAVRGQSADGEARHLLLDRDVAEDLVPLLRVRG